MAGYQYKEDGDVLYGADLMTNLQSLGGQILDLSSDATRTSSDTVRYLRKDALTIRDYTNSTCFCKKNIAFCDMTDGFDDGSVDGNIWTSSAGGAITEESSGADGYLKMYINSTAAVTNTITGDQTNALDMKAADCEVLVNWETSGTSSGSYTLTTKLQLHDGTNTVDLLTKTATDTGLSVANTTVRLVVDVSGTNVYVYEGLDDTSSTTIDVSAATEANWYLRVYSYSTSTGTTTMTTKVWSVGYLNGTAGSSIYRSSAQTITSADSGIMIYPDTKEPSESFNFSFDNAANFVSAPERAIAESTAGTQAVHRLTVTHPTSISVGSSDRNIEYMDGDIRMIY